MKKNIILLLLLPILSFAQVGVNTTAPKAALDVESSNNGMLIPRVQLTSILDNVTVVNPNAGPLETSTLVYNMAPAGVAPNNVVAGFYYWNNAAIPAEWVPVAKGTSWNLYGNSGTNATTLFNSNFTPTENFIGTTDYKDLYIGTNNYPRIKINAFGNVGIGTDNPNAKLHINDNSPYISSWINKTNVANGFFGYVSPTFVVNTTSTSSGISDKNYSAQFSSNGTNISTNIAASFNAAGAANNYAIVVPENSGDVGIGTETPTTKLHIEKATAGAVRIVDGTQAAGRVLTSDATGLATWQSVGTLGTAWSVNGNSAISTPTTPATYGTSTIGAAQNFLGTTNANDVTVGTNNIERMRVKNTTGFVGIGTAVPATPFEVASNGVNEFRLSSRGTFGTSRFSMISDKELASEWRPTYIESADNGGFTGRMDFFTNGTGVANKFGSVRAMSITNGNVGIGRTDPSIKLDILASGNSNGLRLLSGNNAEISYLSIGRTSGHAQIASCTAGNFFLDALDGDMAIKNFSAGKILLGASVGANAAMAIIPGGNVGIGTATPSNLLHVNSATSGAVRIVDGTQGVNKVLTSDATGVATWQQSALTATSGNLVASGTGFSIPYNTSNFLQTGSSITLPPGKYVVNVTMLMSVFPSSTPNNSSFWLRTAFSDSSLPNPTRTSDTVGSYYVSGNLPGSSFFGILSGSLIINNTSGANKTYYYIAGEALPLNTTQSLLNYSGWGEDTIVAYRIN